MAIDESAIAARVIALLRGQGFRGRQGATGPAGPTGTAGAQGATGPAGGGGGGGLSSVDTATGITGGPITGSGVVRLMLSGVTPGTYYGAIVTVDGLGRVTVATGMAAAPEEITSAAGAPTGTVCSVGTQVTRVTSDASGGASAVRIPTGLYIGQVKSIYWVTEGGGGDSVRIYPGPFYDGTYNNAAFRVMSQFVWSASGWKQFAGLTIV